MSDRVPILSLTRKDFKVETYRASGPGGQHRNTTDSAVRITHPLSGAVATCCKNRSQHSNIRDAFKDLTNRSKFQKWLRMEILHKSGLMARIESEVDAMVCPANLKTEVQDEKGKWVEVELNE